MIHLLKNIPEELMKEILMIYISPSCKVFLQDYESIYSICPKTLQKNGHEFVLVPGTISIRVNKIPRRLIDMASMSKVFKV